MNVTHAVVINPFIKYRGLELYGNLERARGKAVTETARRDLVQSAVEGTYRFLGDRLYVSSRYNAVSGRLAGMTGDIGVQRVQGGAGWFITPLILMKGELVSQSTPASRPPTSATAASSGASSSRAPSPSDLPHSQDRGAADHAEQRVVYGSSGERQRSRCGR